MESWNRLAILFILGGVFAGCAAQDAYRQRFTVEREYEKKAQAAPQSPMILKAGLEIKEGYQFLATAEFDRAIKSFRQADDTLSGKAPLVPAPQPIPPAPSVGQPISKSEPPKLESIPAESVTPLGQKPMEVAAVKPAPPVAPEGGEISDEADEGDALSQTKKRRLPKEALAKYLSGKKRKVPEEVVSPNAAQDVEPPEVLTESSTGGPDTLVKAPAKPGLRAIPERENISNPADAGDSSSAVALAPTPSKPSASMKRRIPGNIRFEFNDPSLQPEAMTTLDQTSKFLLDNPSTTLILQGKVTPGEPTTLTDARYESIRSYLIGKGVPEDQIRLDSERHGGRISEFSMFVIEH